jgi:hypothetical protein
MLVLSGSGAFFGRRRQTHLAQARKGASFPWLAVWPALSAVPAS